MRDEALCFSREIRWMFVAVHLRPPRNNKIYLSSSWMESCNGHKSKIPLHIQTLIPIKMHEVRRSGDNGGHNIHCDVDCQDSWSGQTQVSGAETRSQRQGLRPSEPESAECHTGVVTVTTSPRPRVETSSSYPSVTTMTENISWLKLT